jgi:RNA polymerase sigma factor (sigma-70 family)
VQVTLEKAYVAWPRISAMESLDAYVRRIMVNALVSTHRLARNRHEFALADPPERGSASHTGDVLDHALLWPLVCALPTRQRAVVVLRYYEDLSEREIAESLGCALGTVKSTADQPPRRQPARGRAAHPAGLPRLEQLVPCAEPGRSLGRLGDPDPARSR